MSYQVGDLMRSFEHHTLGVARDMSAQGQVELMPSAPGASRLFGMVRSLRGRKERVWASARPHASGAWEGECTCGARYGCPHVAAVLLAALGPEAEAAFEVAARRRETPARRRRAPAFQAVRERPPETTRDERMFESWLRRVDAALRPDAASERKTVAPLRRLIYLLDQRVPAGERGNLTIWPVVVHIRKKGGFGAQRRCGYEGGPGAPDYVASEDRDLLASLRSGSTRGWGFSVRTPVSVLPESAPRLLEALLATGRCHWQDRNRPPLRAGAPRQGTLEWAVADDGSQAPRLTVVDDSGGDSGGDGVAGPARVVLLATRPPWYVDPASGTCGPVETGLADELLEAMLEAPRLTPDHAERARARLAQTAGSRGLPLPRVLEGSVEDRYGDPVPVLSLQMLQPTIPDRLDEGDWPEPGLVLSFRYGDISIAHRDGQQVVQRAIGDTLVRVHRNLEREAAAAATLEDLGWLDLDEMAQSGESLAGFVAIDCDDDDEFFVDFTRERVPFLQSAGWVVNIAHDWPFHVVEASGWYADIHEGVESEWFELELGIEIDGHRVSLLPVLVNLLRDPRHAALLEEIEGADADAGVVVRLDDGRRLTFPAARLRAILGTLIELYRGDPGAERLSLSTWGAPRLAELEEALEDAEVQWSGGERLREMGRSLRAFRGLESIATPDGFRGELRHYQRQGLDWLQFLRAHGLSGILADDMGLGKTVQLLAHLLVERRAGRTDRPSLVVAPTSLMANWRQEAARFAPELRVLTLHGPNRKGRFDELGDCDLALTTYPLLHRDADRLCAQPFHLAVFDEAQFIKNAGTKAARAARTIEARQRICLTGTPMENHLGELWSLFHLLEPGLLGDRKQFRRIFRTPIEKYGDSERSRALAARVRPFLLRRTKDQVELDLPPKSEMTRVVELHAGQRDLYESIRSAMLERVRKEVARKGLAQASIVILDALLRLRQVCCDPRLVKLEKARQVKESAKLDALLEMLDELTAEGRHILLFSQFTSMLARIEQALDQRGLSWVKLTGDTRDRETPVRRFQQGDVPIFLISLRAGGTGLNLTAADTVIHYDPWWNPAVEDQATDRAHRIGQNKPVFVYKLIVAGSVEEKMLALGARKRALAEGIYGAGKDTGPALSAEDLEVLFRPLE